MNEDELFEIASRFREAIEESDLSADPRCSEGASRLEGFPDGACAEVVELLGLFLREEFDIDDLVKWHGIIKENGEWIGSHYWLRHNEIIIDITADQFELGAPSIIAEVGSKFHSNYAHDLKEQVDTMFWEHQSDWMKPLYEVVTAKYFELENSENSE